MLVSALLVPVALAAAPPELRWGADAEGGAPYVFEQPPGHLRGFEAELAGLLAERLRRTPRHVQGPFAQLLPLLERGDVDVVINGIEATDDRARAYALSRPYWAGPERLTVRRGDPHAPASLADLRGRRVGTLPGTLAERMLRGAGADVRTYDGGQEDPYRDLALGRTDAVLLDAPIALYYGERPELTTLPDGFGEIRYAVVARSSDTQLRDAVSSALETLVRDGTLPALLQRWGLWTDETGRALGVATAPSGPTMELDAWRVRSTEGISSSGVGSILSALGRGALVTLFISVASMALAVALGAALALARVYGPAPLRALALGYVELFRGTPLLLQLIVVYYGLPELGLKLSPLVAGWLALGLNYAAAEAENDRAGLLAVPRTQMDAARVLGLGRWQAIRHVIAPQAIRVALPPVTNDFIALLKDSSLVSVVTVTELTKTYGTLAAATRAHLGLGLLVGAMYLLLGLPFARLSRWVEQRLGEHLEVSR
ncbi:MAG TPA: ABC transporter substrate-binding protein/permease [Myxococcaceae bacterium]|nr:ABC transporter substrate-binding protein/permease [Myxococcaceae bacterium]